MELSFTQVYSTVKPPVLEFNANTVYIRKDITCTAMPDGDPDSETDLWVYQEAKLSPEAFNLYMNMLTMENAADTTSNSNNIIKLLSTQETTDANQLTVMEAIADLYELLLS